MKIIDKLIRNMLKFAGRPEWEALLDDVWWEHLEHAAEVLEQSPEDVETLINECGWNPVLFGVVFEHFLSIPHPEKGDRTFAEAYLKQVGWREPNRARRYLQSLAESPMSLYEVVEISPEKGMVLRDLLTNGSTFFVREKSATRNASPWDVFAGRVVEDLDKKVLAGGLLLLPRAEAGPLIEQIRETLASLDAGERRAALETVPVLVTSLWLTTAVANRNRPLPEIRNRGGEELLFAESRLPLVAPAARVTGALDRAPGWKNTGSEPPFWNWLGSDHGDQAEEGDTVKFDTTNEDGTPVLGNLELKEDHLYFTTNSRERMEKGLAVLKTILGDHIGVPLTSYQTPEAVLEGGREMVEPPRPDIPAEELAAIEREFLDKHYRETFRNPIPALGDRTPAEAIATEEGRGLVIDWLKSLEHHEARRSKHSGGAAYDVSWMWRELGLDRNNS